MSKFDFLVLEDLPEIGVRFLEAIIGCFVLFISFIQRNWGYLFVFAYLSGLAVFFDALLDAETEVLTWQFWTADTERFRNLTLSVAAFLAPPITIFGLFLVSRRTIANERQASAQLAQVTNLSNQIRLAEQAQQNERFTTAVEQLGSQNTSVRMGAVYALELLSNDSSYLEILIVDVLSAFVRNGAPKATGKRGYEYKNRQFDRPAVDIQAAVEVLLRVWERSRSDNDRTLDLRFVSLRGIDLTGATFYDVDLSDADLSGAELQHCAFVEARIWDTLFYSANLRGANFDDIRAHACVFDGCELHDARFDNENISFCSFKNAELAGTSFRGSTLNYAEFNGAILSTIYEFHDVADFSDSNLTREQLSVTKWNKEKPPIVPSELRLDDGE